MVLADRDEAAVGAAAAELDEPARAVRMDVAAEGEVEAAVAGIRQAAPRPPTPTGSRPGALFFLNHISSGI